MPRVGVVGGILLCLTYLLCFSSAPSGSSLFIPAYGKSQKTNLRRERSRLLKLKKRSEKARKELEKTIRTQRKLKKDVRKLEKALKKKVNELKKVTKELDYIEKFLIIYDKKIGSEKSKRRNLSLIAQKVSLKGQRLGRGGLITISSEREEEKERYYYRVFFAHLIEEEGASTRAEGRLEKKLERLEGKRAYWEKRGVREEKRKKFIKSRREKGKKELAKVAVKRQRMEIRYGQLKRDIKALQKAVSSIEKRARKRKGRKKLFLKSIPSGYTFPAKGRVISLFGRVKDKNFDIYVENKGIEVSGRSGGAIRAVSGGVVVYKGVLSGFGKIAVIEHKGDIFSVYGKAALYNVNVGDRVKKGQRIGALARIAHPRLYFELRVGGEPVNPLKYVRIPR